MYLVKRRKNRRVERGGVSELIAALEKAASSPLYVFVDRDSGGERSKSGFDFLLVYKGQTVFVEAKARTELSPFQKLTRRRIENAGGRYIVCKFTVDEATGKKWFVLDTSSATQLVAEARPERFF